MCVFYILREHCQTAFKKVPQGISISWNLKLWAYPLIEACPTLLHCFINSARFQLYTVYQEMTLEIVYVLKIPWTYNNQNEFTS